jgi:hypothetical protein
VTSEFAFSNSRISGYFWGVEGLSEDFLKPEEEEFGVGHAT